MSRKPIRPSRNAATATSLAALYAHGYVPPRLPRLAREREQRERLEVGLEELERPGGQVERRQRRRGAVADR